MASTSRTNVHLLVLCHGMWGSVAHLQSMKDAMLALHPEHKKYSLAKDEAGDSPQYEFRVLALESNQEQHTYDGIDWGGERFVAEVQQYITTLESDGTYKVTRFSITGYSLGGLLARYVIGALHSQKFFDRVEPVNFNTIATPHLGIPRYPGFFSGVGAVVGPRLLGRTGPQFYAVDKWDEKTGQSLLEIMADPESIFFDALRRFQNVTIYANTINDTTVPYLTSAIETEDPFLVRETNGLKVEFDETYAPIIKSYSIPSRSPSSPTTSSDLLPTSTTPTPTAPAPSKRKSRFPRPKLFIPPFLRFTKYPYTYLNIFVAASLPFLFPLMFGVALTRLSLDSRASAKRIRVLEAGDSKGTGHGNADETVEGAGVGNIGEAMRRVRKQWRRVVEEAEEMAVEGVERVERGKESGKEEGEGSGGDVLEQSEVALALGMGAAGADGDEDEDGDDSVSPSPVNASEVALHKTAVASPSTPLAVESTSASLPSSTPSTSTSTSTSKHPHHHKKPKKTLPHLSPAQHRMASHLNTLPHLKKVLVFIAGGAELPPNNTDPTYHLLFADAPSKSPSSTSLGNANGKEDLEAGERKKNVATPDNFAHAHAIIVARDLARFPESHKRGFGVLRHWADAFVM